MNNNYSINLGEQAKSLVLRTLGEIPAVEILDTRSDFKASDRARADIVIDVLISGEPWNIIVEVKSSGEPRIAQLAAYQLSYITDLFPRAYSIFVAPYLSDRARQICRDMEIGCLDLAGNVYLKFGQVLIDKGGAKNPYTVNRGIKSLFSPKTSRVLRVLLKQPYKPRYVKEIAAEANVSMAQASRVRTMLKNEGLIKEEKKRFWLIDPEELLNNWANEYDYKKNKSSQYYTKLQKDEFEVKLAKECTEKEVSYAFALFSAGDRIAPWTNSPRTFAFIGSGVENIIDLLELKQVNSGANVVLLKPYDEGVFAEVQEIDDVKVVSDIQAFLDLNSYAGRGKEAAEAILKEKIRPRWLTDNQTINQ